MTVQVHFKGDFLRKKYFAVPRFEPTTFHLTSSCLYYSDLHLQAASTLVDLAKVTKTKTVVTLIFNRKR